MNWKKALRWETLLVAIFVIGLLFMFSREAEASDGGSGSSPFSVGVGLGVGVANYLDGRTQTLTVRYNSVWGAQYERLGGKGRENVSAYSVSRRVFWSPVRTGYFMSLGAQYFDSLVEDIDDYQRRPVVSERLTYQLGLGYLWKVSDRTKVGLGLLHSSTAGRSERNRGIDRIELGIEWRL